MSFLQGDRSLPAPTLREAGWKYRLRSAASGRSPQRLRTDDARSSWKSKNCADNELGGVSVASGAITESTATRGPASHGSRRDHDLVRLELARRGMTCFPPKRIPWISLRASQISEEEAAPRSIRPPRRFSGPRRSHGRPARRAGLDWPLT